MKPKIFIVIAIIFLFSCQNNNNVPKGILPPSKMQMVLWDVLRADALTFDFIKKDSLKKPEAENIKLQMQIFDFHKTTKDEFYNSYQFYKTHPNMMQPLLDSMINKGNREKYSSTKGTIIKDSIAK